TALALNRTALDFQSAMRTALPQRCTIRSSVTLNFFTRMIKIATVDRATKQFPTVTISIAGPSSGSIGAQAQKAQLLARHELGGVHTAPLFFIPAPGLRSASSNIPKALYPVNLGLTPRKLIAGGSTGGGTQGKRRTYVVPGVGIFQRISKDETDLLWLFRQRIVLKPRLGFYATAQATVQSRWIPNFSRAFAEAIHTAF
ncbi:MAG: hypothetical protein ACRENC_18865, partial [Gemmatimonadaceae bacterium]